MNKQIMYALALAVVAGASFAKGDAQAKRFAKFDTNKDGKLSLEEFTAMVKTEYEKKGKPNYEKAAANRFKNRDTNKDGFLSLEEFKGTAKKQPQNKEKEQ